MKKFLLSLILVIFISRVSAYTPPDEGMWLPLLLKKLNESDMKKHGCKLTADDIYNINKTSFKDAIFRLGNGFCTAEAVSSRGLLFTNHHCGYDAIATHSSEKNDYLKNGFWAESFDKEIPTPGLTVSRLVRMEDVTNAVEQSGSEMKVIRDSLIKVATEGTEYQAEFSSMFLGNQYFIMVYETFYDVRFVAAPPSSIGKFGGDTDNWMWPRHTGDFSILRIYVSPEGKPAKYNPQNVPYTPKKHLKVSLKGIKETDFSMIMGFPGHTERYLTSFDFDYKQNIEQPVLISLFGKVLEIMKHDMDKNRKLGIKMASNYASLANSYKYYKGQNLGLKKYNLVEKRQKDEVEFSKWVTQDPKRKEEYGELLDDIKKTYQLFQKKAPGALTMMYSANSIGEMLEHVIIFWSLRESLKSKKETDQATKDELKAKYESFFESGTLETYKKILPEVFILFYNNSTDEDKKSNLFTSMLEKSKGKTDIDKIRNYFKNIYKKSILFKKKKLDKFVTNPTYKILEKEEILNLTNEIITFYMTNYGMLYKLFINSVEENQKKYVKAYMDWKSDKKLYPDANSTLRLSYGNVMGYKTEKNDFKYYTLAKEILEKENPKNPEFEVHPKLKTLIQNKDYGRYGKDGQLNVCFVSNNDITGGNSGSPVMDGEGNLIGIAFDGNWESMTGDLIVDPELNRTINVDIRYVLFVIDKFAGSKRIIDELDIID